MGVTKIKESINIEANMKFGSYSSVYFRSGAYLLMPDTQSEQEVCTIRVNIFENKDEKQIFLQTKASFYYLSFK